MTDALDVVSRMDELQNPMLVIHGAEDFVYSLDNARNLEAAYIERAASVEDLAPLTTIERGRPSEENPQTCRFRLIRGTQLVG